MVARVSIPPINERDPQQRQVLEALKQAAEVSAGVRGDPLDRAVTVRDLLEGGLAGLPKGISRRNYIQPSTLQPLAGSQKPNLAKPPKPTGLTASRGFGTIFLTWSMPSYSNHRHTNIYRNTDDNFANAVVVTNATGSVYADYAPYEESNGEVRAYYYWIAFVSDAGVEGPPNAVSGVRQTPEAEPQYMLNRLQGMLTPDQLADDFTVVSGRFAVVDDENSVVLGVVDGKTVMNGAYMLEASIDHAAIKSLNVNQLTGDKAAFVRANIGNAIIGSAQLQEIIQSENYAADTGWMINRNGQAVFNNIHARGVIEGSRILGSVVEGGIVKGTTLISSSQVRVTDAGDPYYTTFASTGASMSDGSPALSYQYSHERRWDLVTGLCPFYPYNAGPSGVGNPSHFMHNQITINVAGMLRASSRSERESTVWIEILNQHGAAVLTALYLPHTSPSISQNGLTCTPIMEGVDSPEFRGWNVSGSFSFSFNSSWGVNPRFQVRMRVATWRQNTSLSVTGQLTITTETQ